jgi:hypothetical protein
LRLSLTPPLSRDARCDFIPNSRYSKPLGFGRFGLDDDAMSQSASQIKPPGKPDTIRQRPTRTEIASAASARDPKPTERDD